MARSNEPVVVIAGAHGLLGTAVAERVREEFGARVRALPRCGSVSHLAPSSSPVLGVINCAGKGLRESDSYAVESVVEANIGALERCISAALALEVPLIHLGTALEAVDSRGDVYVNTKRMAGELFAAAKMRPQLPIRGVHLQIHNVYGPGVPGVVSEIVQSHRRGSPALLARPYAFKDFIYLTDVAAAVAAALRVGDVDGPVAVGSRSLTRISDVAELISQHTGVKPAWLPLDHDLRDARSTDDVGNQTGQTSPIGWRPLVELTHGIDEVLAKVPTAQGALGRGRR